MQFLYFFICKIWWRCTLPIVIVALRTNSRLAAVGSRALLDIAISTSLAPIAESMGETLSLTQQMDFLPNSMELARPVSVKCHGYLPPFSMPMGENFYLFNPCMDFLH